jgi:competence protein ComEC
MHERYPLLLPLTGLIAGILLSGFSERAGADRLLVALAIAAALSALLFSIKKIQLAPVYLLVFTAVGYCLSGLQNERLQDMHIVHKRLDSERSYYGKIAAYPVPTKKAIRLEIELLADNGGEALAGAVYLYVPKDSIYYAVLPGDHILFTARLNEINPPKNPYEFDYRNYLHLHQVYVQAYTNQAKIISTPGFSILRWSSKLRADLLAVIGEMPLTDDEKAIASALLLGYRHYISDDTTRAFAGAGAMHVLAVSGLHVGILYMVLAFFLGIDRKKPHKSNGQKVLVTLCVIWLYAILTGLSPSVSRAAVMFSFIALGGLMSRNTSSIQAVMASALVLLFVKPNLLFEVGFQLSYAAVFGIIYLQPKIYRLIPPIHNKPLDYAWQITAVSIAAQAGTFPLSVYYFHQFPTFFIFSNLFVIPLAFLTMGYGLFVLVISAFTGVLSWLVWPLKSLLWLMIQGVSAIERMPNAVMRELWMSRVEVILLLVLVFSLAEVFWKNRKWALFLATTCVIALILTGGWRSREQTRQHRLTFYGISKQSAIEYRRGRESVLFASHDLLRDEDAMLFHVRHNLWAGGIKDMTEQALDSNFQSRHVIKSGKLIDTKSARILLLAQATDTAYFALNPSHALVTNNIKAPHSIPQDVTVVLESGLRSSTRASWKKLPNAVHDLGEEPALEVNLNND